MIQEEPLSGRNFSCFKETEKGQCGLLAPTISKMPFWELHGLGKSQLTHCCINIWALPEFRGCMIDSHAQRHFREQWFGVWKKSITWNLLLRRQGQAAGLLSANCIQNKQLQPLMKSLPLCVPVGAPPGSVCAHGGSSGHTALSDYRPIQDNLLEPHTVNCYIKACVWKRILMGGNLYTLARQRGEGNWHY